MHVWNLEYRYLCVQLHEEGFQQMIQHHVIGLFCARVSSIRCKVDMMFLR